MLKLGAWSVPVIAAAVAVPAAVASTETPVEACEALPAGAFIVVGGTLMTDGRSGTLPSASGNFGTGWLPPIEPTGDWQTGYTQTAQAVAPTVARSWWQGGGDIDKPGFMSLDDNDNRDGAPQTSTTISLQFVAPVVGGRSYEFELPVYTAASYLGTQYLAVSVEGAGVSIPAAVIGYAGTPSISLAPGGVETYPQFGAEQKPTVSFTAAASGDVAFNYTFTLSYVTGGARQNADIVVQAPQLLTCV